jgi:hypothetical protein
MYFFREYYRAVLHAAYRGTNGESGIDIRITDAVDPVPKETCLFCENKPVFKVFDGRLKLPLVEVYVCSQKFCHASAISYILSCGYGYTLEGSYVSTGSVDGDV